MPALLQKNKKGGGAMVMDFVLYAFDPEREISVPLLIVAMPSAVYEFFATNKFADKTQGQALMEWLISKLAKKNITLAHGWEYFLENLSVALRKDDRVYLLPRVFVQ